MTLFTGKECNSLYEHLEKMDNMLEQLLNFSEEVFSYDKKHLFLAFLQSKLDISDELISNYFWEDDEDDK